jgi:predicted MPP superfamily phosphohydrolase
MKRLEYLLLVMIFFCASCAKDQWFDPPSLSADNNSQVNLIYPQIKIAVASDIHYLNPSIAPDDPENNPVWQAMVTHDRKIFEFSDPIFRKVVTGLMDDKPDILLISGDMAMEGQMQCHNTVSGFLQQLEDCGIKVFVVPGNNDINNPSSQNFKDTPPSPVPSVTEEEFTSIYGSFGYNEALYRDENSLSYICQPYNGLWILGIDGVDRSNPQKISGAINPLTLAWIQEKMVEANENNFTVLAMMHYGIIEHYSGQNYLESLISDPKNNANALMNSGIRLIFTGHYHASDIADYSKDGKTLTDIQTGSLVTPPYSYRMMTLEGNVININTKIVKSLGSEISHQEFLKYSNKVFTERITGFFTYYGKALQKRYGIPADKYPEVVPFFTKAYMAYLAGDEKLEDDEAEKIQLLGQTVPSALPFLNSLWDDPPPQDNKFHLKLK